MNDVLCTHNSLTEYFGTGVKSMRNKTKIFSMVLVGIIVGATPALAVDMTWDGQGVNSVVPCISDQQPYLHWILNGVATDQTYPLDLILGGTGSGTYPGSRNGNSGTYSFDTEFFDLNGLTAKVLDVPGEPNNLVISGGCTGTTSIPEFPTVALPIAAILGLVFFFYQRKNNKGE